MVYVLGYAKTILMISAPFFGALIALASFSYGLYTAILFVAGLAVFSYLYMRFSEKHSQEYDDRLATVRVEKAQDEYIAEMEEKKRK